MIVQDVLFGVGTLIDIVSFVNGMQIWSNIELSRERECVVGDIVPIFKGGGVLLREDLYFLFLLFLIIRFTLWEESIQSA